MTKSPLATAIYNDIWSGQVVATVVAFRTKRRGETVSRYRWLQSNGMAAGGFVAGGFSTVAGAVAAAQRHACFSDVIAAASLEA